MLLLLLLLMSVPFRKEILRKINCYATEKQFSNLTRSLLNGNGKNIAKYADILI